MLSHRLYSETTASSSLQGVTTPNESTATKETALFKNSLFQGKICAKRSVCSFEIGVAVPFFNDSVLSIILKMSFDQLLSYMSYFYFSLSASTTASMSGLPGPQPVTAA